MSTAAGALWIVVKKGGYVRAPGSPPPAAGADGTGVAADVVYEHPMYWPTLDEDEARKQAQHAKAALVRLPITEDYREGQS